MKSLHFKFTPKVLFFCLLGLWTLVKTCSALFSELIPDEAYYFLYAQHLDWGYFDHPPMVALFIKIGSFIHNELGVRLLAVISQPIVLVVLWKMIDIKKYSFKDVFLFFGIAASITMFQVYGFIMTPDVPLLLFSSLFLLCYKKFLEKESCKSVILLGIIISCLLYSKYQAILLLLWVLIS
ncbi:MAG: glycosyltransferase family 39 protein, partial [Bacteroidales bacterium]|nr:glycosyltransferase family 39 protein [Bacteroidales bacterium]